MESRRSKTMGSVSAPNSRHLAITDVETEQAEKYIIPFKNKIQMAALRLHLDEILQLQN